jgi:hypothetical protein
MVRRSRRRSQALDAIRMREIIDLRDPDENGDGFSAVEALNISLISISTAGVRSIVFEFAPFTDER